MKWKVSNHSFDSLQVIISYGNSLDLHPITEYLHQGILPIGKAFSDDELHNLPNLDWIVRHLAYCGVVNFVVMGSEKFKGLQRYYTKSQFPELNFKFINSNLLDDLSILKGDNKIQSTLVIDGMTFTNADYTSGIEFHLNSGQDATLFSFRGLKYRVGLVEIEDHIVTSFREKPIDKSKVINSNIFMINSDIVKDEFIDMIQKNNISYNRLTSLIFFLSKNIQFHNFELSAIDDSKLWVEDLSSIEQWIKLDPESFIDKYEFLISKD